MSEPVFMRYFSVAHRGGADRRCCFLTVWIYLKVKQSAVRTSTNFVMLCPKSLSCTQKTIRNQLHVNRTEKILQDTPPQARWGFPLSPQACFFKSGNVIKISFAATIYTIQDHNNLIHSPTQTHILKKSQIEHRKIQFSFGSPSETGVSLTWSCVVLVPPIERKLAVKHNGSYFYVLLIQLITNITDRAKALSCTVQFSTDKLL